jgi:hypothetical protein
MPKAGKIKAYTSGCPKNQNKCWNKIGSPPPIGSKKEVLIFRSKSNIVIPLANTGKDRTNKNTVIITLQTNNLIFSKLNSMLRVFHKVTIKLIPPKIEETPAKCKLKIA